MLSRLAQTSRVGLTASRLSRPTVSPILRARPVAVTVSPWIRTYAKKNNNNNSAQSSNKNSPPNTSKGPSTPENKSAKNDDVSTPNEQPAPEGAAKEPEAIPFHKLPDLTQGIPSTLDAELEDKAGRSGSSLTAVEEDPTGTGRGRDRRDSYVSTNERNRKWWARFFMAAAGSGTLLSVAYMGRDWEDAIEAERHPDVPNGWTPALWWARTKARWGNRFERPYTLCISLDNMLVHSEWTREHGWRVAKRPGMDYFIRYLSQYYELVLFTTVPFAMGEPLVRKLDPFRFIMWPLYREATKYEEGELVKDLGYLNRDLSKVIVIDTKPEHIRKHPENAIILDPWKGDPNDKELVALIPFLEYIHTMQYSDVRKVLKSFEGKHIPTEFARREAIARKEFNKQVQGKKQKTSGVGALGNLLGMKPSNMSMTMAPDGEPNPSEAFAQGKMLQDIARERGIRNYQMLEKEIRENGEKWLKEEQQAIEKAQQEAMNSMMGSFSGWFAPPKTEEEKKA
ncbi:Mitochondrial import inner membrane translocase subunit TIM50 [Cladobotryum mycophilum]|uniref:Mitochondrial import inner membrane translocase subunit TIM50 n=1 Tax=Cladobotryum mycophilum TaxID=491253 RepID=A0ABR0S4Z2_9HYPO